jgi:hypothetical protein
VFAALKPPCRQDLASPAVFAVPLRPVRVQSENEGEMPATELNESFRWARDKADAADPLLKSPEALIEHHLITSDRGYQIDSHA